MENAVASSMSLDSTSLTVVMVVALGSFGYWWGVRAEGITLAGILGFTAVLATDGVSRQIGVFAASGPLGIILDSPDRQAILGLIVFIMAAAAMYFAGATLGGRPSSSAQRIAGVVMGSLSGFISSIALTQIGLGFSRQHPDLGQIRIGFPSLPSLDVVGGSSFPALAPWVFLGALSIVILLAFASLVGARR
ncbi:MAG: hypothetical protein ABIH46_10175 [Chloroflexota bacterium]